MAYWLTNEKPKKETSGPALRYLRSSNDFVYRQLADLDIPAIADTLYFKTYGWLLKLVALELHITTQAKQRSNQLRLITLLFKRSGAVSETFTNSMVQAKVQKRSLKWTVIRAKLSGPYIIKCTLVYQTRWPKRAIGRRKFRRPLEVWQKPVHLWVHFYETVHFHLFGPPIS